MQEKGASGKKISCSMSRWKEQNPERKAALPSLLWSPDDGLHGMPARSLVGEIRERGEGELLQSGDVMEVIRPGRSRWGRIVMVDADGFTDGIEWKRKVVPK